MAKAIVKKNVNTGRASVTLFAGVPPVSLLATCPDSLERMPTFDCNGSKYTYSVKPAFPKCAYI